jgi:serine/threonine protein kinase/tetratricopeptide (TPR) repeat protein
MRQILQCPECHSELGTDDPEGLCPRCVFGAALDADTAADDLEAERYPGKVCDFVETAEAPDESASMPGGALPSVPRYRILRMIGTGGMGEVYEAEQAHPRRRVAVKLIRNGRATPQVLKRFELESEVLGKLQHPGIAHVFESGAVRTPQGLQPFLAMELVFGADGAHAPQLHHYADAMQLDVRARLALLAKVADAVHYAHQRGVVHRDLKPANILVDQTGQPKILDFGVARLTGGGAAATMQTDMGQMVGTLPYMSVEQLAGRQDDVDARSDVYSLGVIAYELLTGSVPHPLAGLPLPAAVRVLIEDEPTRLGALDRSFRGEVETIVATAMEKESSRRYASAAAFAADIRRYLDDRPITARPATAWCRIRKFTSRNAALVTTAIVILLLLTGGIVGTSIGLVRAREAEKTANALTKDEERKRREIEDLYATLRQVDDYIRGIIEGAHPLSSGGGQKTTVVDLLRRAEAQLETSLKGRWEQKMNARFALGRSYEGLGLYEDAVKNLGSAYALAKSQVGERDKWTIEVGANLAWARFKQNEEGREDFARAVLAASSEVLGDAHEATQLAANALGCILLKQDRHAEGEAVLKKMLPTMRDQGARLLCPYLHNLALAAKAQGRLTEAESLQKEALANHRDPIQAARAREVLASILTTAGKLDEALEHSEEAVREMRRWLGDTHWDTIRTIGRHAMLLTRREEHEAALANRRQQLELAERAEARDDEEVANIHANIGALQLTGEKVDLAGAAESFARAIAARPGGWAQDKWRFWIVQSGLGNERQWTSPALRMQVMSAVLDTLREQPTNTYALDELRWAEMRFSLARWGGASSDGDPSGSAVEGGLSELRELKDPEPGLYVMSLRVPRNGGRPVQELLWLLFSAWDVRLYVTEGAPCDDAAAWEEVKRNQAGDRRRVAALALANEWYKGFGPNGRTEHFALVAATQVEMPEGQYLMSISRDKGARVWIDDRLRCDGWETAGHFPTEITDATVVEVSGGTHSVRVEYHQGVDRSRLWLRVEPLDESATKTAEAVAVGDGELLMRAALRQARALERAGSLPRAEAAYGRAADLAVRAGTDVAERQRIQRGLARSLSGQGKRESAIQACRDALELCVQMRQGEHDDLLAAARELAAELIAAGGAANVAEGVKLHRGIVEARARSPKVGEAMLVAVTELGEAYVKAGMAEEARDVRQRLLEIARASSAKPSSESSQITHRVAQLLERLGDWRAVEDAYDVAFDAVVAAEGETFNSTHRLHGLANAQSKQAKLRQAEQTYRQALEIRARTMGAKHPELSWTLGDLAGVLQAAGNADGAVACRREAVEICSAAWGDHRGTTNDALLRLAEALASAGRSDQAESTYVRAISNLTRYKGETHPATHSAREGFERWLQTAGRPRPSLPEALVAATETRFGGSGPRPRRGTAMEKSPEVPGTGLKAKKR